ncbi:gamma-BHC dehydrochlorinase [alpha proteobacterium U9-1i]|nr:gamma-BHC dehydrochlorinase [alpha proteobacterium U9-1i]
MENTDRRRALLAMFAAPVGVAACATADAQPAGGGHAEHGQMMASLAERLDRAEARFAVNETLFNYARACDRADEAMMRNCFWPESTHKHGRFDGTSTQFIGFAFGIISRLKIAAHHISNVSVEVRGDRAFSECYYMAHHRRNVGETQNEEDVFMEGRYIDLHERRDGVWKIIRRRGFSDFSSAAIPAATLASTFQSGRAPTDEYYSIRAEFLAGL